MSIDTAAIDDAILALLQLGLHEGNLSWKGYDWDALERLHQRGLIANPANKSKSVILTGEGLAESARLFNEHFVNRVR
ncbi:DUF6429 family protein [Luteibacter aegosomatissinici]|uniref:DUF6429 family protein n=1 Tax=Luteibacter aegosomatissinici TaxID=2911539 RepID=UPI001FF9E60F|nr:DUF6429 family protein [Luteibacter aegosomatissinici]UPG93884.1 DUF6429 family protein [Luteibacter aegosomatissinici]